MDSAALARLYGLFAGDLRGTLRALDEAAHALVGYGAEAASPMTWEDMLPVLRERYEREMADQLTDTQAGYLRKLAGSLEATVTQKTLMGIWSVSQATVSEIAGELVARGYLEAEPYPPPRTWTAADPVSPGGGRSPDLSIDTTDTTSNGKTRAGRTVGPARSRPSRRTAATAPC